MKYWGAVLIAGCSTPAPPSAEAAAQPIAAGDVTVKVNYLLRGQQFEIEIPFTVPAS